MKKMRLLKSLLIGALLLSGCSESTPPKQTNNNYSYTLKDGKANGQFMGPFDTLFQVIMYEEDEQTFEEHLAFIQERFTYYHQLFDKYNTYENIINVKSINDHAGEFVTVEKPLFDLIETSIALYNTVSTQVDITLGPVLEVWHEYREKNDGSIPSQETLTNANQYVGINHITLDKEKQAVKIDEHSALDVGATAKGYACELVKAELIQRGCDDFLISAGGNVITHGKRAKLAGESNLAKYLPDCRTYYTIDVINPFDTSKGFCALTLNGMSAVTSGDYQRFYVGSDGLSYHHLVDPTTLQPARYFRSVTIVTKDSGLADFMSSALFLTPLEKGQALVESMPELDAIWVTEDGSVYMSSGLKEGVNIHVYD